MTRVITYGTFDMLHYGHVRLLKRARELGDYFVVGITADSFDKARGKINVKQSLMERVEAVKNLNIADEIIIEEYEGQKIDDIKRLNIDVFTVGSDWIGKFDYLNEYCKVVYLDRTEGISSSELRTEERHISFGIVGEGHIAGKFENECKYVNGVEISGYFTENPEITKLCCTKHYPDFESLLNEVDALYIISHPTKHYKQIKLALEKGKHVICESPVAMNKDEAIELFTLAQNNDCLLFDGIKTAYSTAFSRLLLLIKSGIIGEVVAIDATCTSLEDLRDIDYHTRWGSMALWGPTALLPIFELLGTSFNACTINSRVLNKKYNYDIFSKVDFIYDNAVASLKVANGVKSEGELIVSGEKGYIYVPAPWWKTDYFEVKFENPNLNKRYFYQLDGEGIRYMILTFVKSIENKKNFSYISPNTSVAISDTYERFILEKNLLFSKSN